MQRLKEKLLALAPLYLLLFFSFVWLWLNRDIYLDPSQTLPRDNLKHHLPMLVYVSDYLRLFRAFPDWLYSFQGGIWLSALANNFLVLMPHRLLGVYLAANTALHPNLIYKGLLWLAQFFFCFGLYRVAGLVFESRWKQVGFVFLSLVTAVTLTFTYQEHALGTLFYIPWLWYCFLRLKDSYRFAMPFCALLGLSLNHHYPQLIVIYVLTLMIAGLTALDEFRDPLVARWKQMCQAKFSFWALCGLAFFISASPVLYSYAKYRDKLESPFRLQKDGIESGNYAQYEIINTALSKLHPENLKLYFNFGSAASVMQTALDESLTYMGPLTAFILFGLIFLKVPLKRFHLFMVLTLAIYACGTHTVAPRVFWNIIPGITLFRQWIFFLVFLNLQFLFLTFAVGKTFLDWKIETWQDKAVALGGTFAFSSLVVLGWVAPLYGVPAIVLLLGKFWKSRHRDLLTRYVFYSWMILGSLNGAADYMMHLRVFLNEWNATHFAKNIRERGTESTFKNLMGTYQQFVALPKGIKGEDYARVNQEGSFFFAGPNGDLSPVPLNEIQFESGVVRIRNDPRFRFLVFPQVNDGEWYIKTDGFLPIVTTSTGSLGTWVKIPSGARYIELTRRKNIWNYLIFLMWVPIALFLVDAFLAKFMQLSLFATIRDKVSLGSSQVAAVIQRHLVHKPS